MKHPLIDQNSTHYGIGKQSTIYRIEEELTMHEMIAVCRFNTMKYQDRDKGQDELDDVKIKKYKAYKVFLETIIEEYRVEVYEIDKMRVRAVLDLLMPNLQY